jgi:hypothetical protein
VQGRHCGGLKSMTRARARISVILL